MRIPLQLKFHNMDASVALKGRIEKEASKLEHFHDYVIAVRVTVEAPHKHHRQGKLYTAKVDVTIPGGELVVGHAHNDRHQNEDPYVAVRDAFKAVTRQLEDKVRRTRGNVKQHTPNATGRIKTLYPQMDYGLIETADGREIYFHRNSLLGNGFDELKENVEVRFAEELGEQGAQASTVHLVGKHHPA